MEKNWYVVHTYSGSEKKVKTNIDLRIDSMGMQDYIFNVLVPEEKSSEFKEGKRQEVIRKIYPGYILVEMRLTDESWSVVRNAPGVTGFVGLGNKPTPLPDREVQSIMRLMGLGDAKPEVKFSLQVGENARVTDGPFASFVGKVEEVDTDKRIVKVLLKIFGRETSVELDFNQVEEA
jgi:transcriptional antiterminator NusG